MKIQTNRWDVANSERLYRQNLPKTNQPLPASEQAKIRVQDQVQKSIETIRPQDILTLKEKQALQALFGFDQNEKFSWYGKNQVRNVTSGFVLDVKG